MNIQWSGHFRSLAVQAEFKFMLCLCHVLFIPLEKQNALWEIVIIQTHQKFSFREWESCFLWPTFAVCRICGVPLTLASSHAPWQSHWLFVQHCFVLISWEWTDHAVQNHIKENTMQASCFQLHSWMQFELNALIWPMLYIYCSFEISIIDLTINFCEL